MITYENTQTIRSLIEHTLEEFPSDPFLRYEKDDVVYDISYESFAGLCRIISSFANELRQKLGRRIKVGLFGSSSVHYVSVLLGVMASGNTAVPLDYQMNLDPLSDCLNRSDVDVLFYDWVHEPLITDVKEKCPKIRAYYSLQSVKKNPCLNDILRNPAYSGKSWSENGADDSVEPDDLAMILFTSGTTGHSKGVMLTNRNLTGNTLAEDRVDYPERPVALSVLPIHHVFCISTDFLNIMTYGGVTCINGPMSMLTKHLILFEPLVIRMVPMIAKILYNKIASMVSAEPSLTEEDVLHQVYGRRLFRIICGGGGLPEELARKYYDLGVNIGQGYGMSECSPIISEPVENRPDKAGSAGKVLKHVEVRISDEKEIQVRSPFVMQGYYGDPELTEEAFTKDGWLRTGDMGYVDDEGFLFLTGRLKNLIILSNGENVAPEELEDGFITEPLISDILVYGENDMVQCEIYPDFLYAEKNNIKNIKEELESIVNLHNENLPPYKRIMRTRMRKSPFKKTTSGKIIRNVFFEEKENVREKTENLRMPANDGEKAIYDLCAEVLGHRKFGTDFNLYECGLDSFGSIMLLTDFQEKLDFSLTLTELMENATVEKLCKLKEKKASENKVDYSVREAYALTPLQMYFAYVLRNNTTANLPFLFRLNKNTDIGRLKEAIRKLFKIHPALTDRIEPGENGYLCNFRDDSREAEIEHLKLTDEEWEDRKRNLLRPYTYQKGENLYHIGIYETESDNYMFFDVAHIIGDGMTMNILFEDLNSLYLGEEVKKSDYSFYEYILDEHARIAAGQKEKDIAFFKELLKGCEIKRSILAKKDSYDLGVPHCASIRGRFSLISQKKLRGLMNRYGISENVFFLTAFSYTVGLFGASDDVVITSIHSGRTDGRWARLAGCLFITYFFRFLRIKHETVEALLKRNAKQILHTMETHMPSMRSDEMFIQYQGDILDIPYVGGEKAERLPIQLEALPFHLMIYSSEESYTYELRYWENRFDREMLTVFLTAMENIMAAMFDETSVRKLKDRLPAKLYPRHFTISAKKLNASLGYEVVPGADDELMIKPYVLDEYGLKKPYGAWGRLYILEHPVNGCQDTIESLYTEGTLYDTGIDARITPDKKVEALYQAGRTVVREDLTGRAFINLFELERTLAAYPGIENAEASVEYGEGNLFHVKAVLTVSKEPEIPALQQYVADKLGKHMTPEIVVIK